MKQTEMDDNELIIKLGKPMQKDLANFCREYKGKKELVTVALENLYPVQIAILHNALSFYIMYAEEELEETQE